MALSKTVSGRTLESGYAEHPDHKITTASAASRFRVAAVGATLADAADALVLQEADYPPVRYFDRRDFDMTRLKRTDHSTWCPFKGRASYYSIADDPALENAVWTYEDPFQEVAAIRDRLAFYPDKVDITEA